VRVESVTVERTEAASPPSSGLRTGVISTPSGNVPEDSWLSPLRFPWVVRVFATEMDKEREELRDWVILARHARLRWMDENPY